MREKIYLCIDRMIERSFQKQANKLFLEGRKKKMKYKYDWEKIFSWIVILGFCITTWIFVIKLVKAIIGSFNG